MKDNEIIKALECCIKDDYNKGCEQCPAHCYKGCDFHLAKFALDLINRQQVEKEALINGQETLQKYIAEKNAEIERLEKGELSKAMTFNSDTIKRCVNKAIKEFAERCKKSFSQCQREYREVLNSDGACAMIIAKKVVDDLVKEMKEK